MTASCEDQAFERFCRHGEPEDLAAVYDATSDRLLRAAQHLAPSLAAAEDLVQATFLAAIEKAPSFQTGRPIAPWLLGILANQAKLARWREGRQLQVDRLASKPVPAPFEAVEQEEFQRALDAAIDKLPASYRPVLLLHLRNDLPAAEIALALGRPAGTVRSQLSRGMAMIRQVLPASLVAMLAVGSTTSRGLAAVREYVLAKVPITAVAGTTGGLLVLGGIAMKQAVLAAVALVAVGFVWMMWMETPDLDPAAVAIDPDLGQPPAKLEATAPVTTDRSMLANAPETADTKVTVVKPSEIPALATGTIEVVAEWGDSGNPARGVAVILLGTGSQWSHWPTARTNHRGLARIDAVTPGPRALRGLRGGKVSTMVRNGQTTRVKLKIPIGVEVKLQVVDGAGTGIPGANVWLSEQWLHNRGLVIGKTDLNGRLRLQNTSPDCSLAVRCRGFEPSNLHPVKGSNGGSVQIRITMRKGGGSLRGVVLDPAGQPIAGARVLVGIEKPAYAHRSTNGAWIPGAPPMRSRTNANGSFRVDGVASGVLPVRVMHPDHAPWEGQAELLAATVARLEITLVQAARLHGVVTGLDGEPAAHARISTGQPNSFSARVVYSNRAGEFSMRGLPSGNAELTAQLHKLQHTEVLPLQAGADLEWNPTLYSRPSITATEHRLRGRVVDANGKPLANWRVAAQQATTHSTTTSANTDQDGRFELAVQWQVARVWTHPPHDWSNFPKWIRDDVRTDDGELLIRIADAAQRTAVVRGKVVDADGRPVQAQIQAWQQKLRLWRQYATDSATGGFEITDVPAGELNLKVRPSEHPWINLKPLTLEVGEDKDLGRIVVAAAGHIEGEARFIDGEAPASLDILITRNGIESAIVRYANGGIRSNTLAAGEYTVQVQGPRIAMAEQKVSVRAGQTTRLDFRLRRAALRELELVLPRGRARPRFLNVQLRDSARRLAWYGGIGSTGSLKLTASVPVGSYQMQIHGPGRSVWLRQTFTVTEIGDLARPIVVQLHAPQGGR